MQLYHAVYFLMAVLSFVLGRKNSSLDLLDLKSKQVIDDDDDVKRIKELLRDPNADAILNAEYIHAAQEGKLDLVYIFLNDSRVQPNASHNLAFIRAASYGRIAVIDHLLSLGENACINPFDRWNSALKYSAIRGHVAIVKRILSISTEIRRTFLQDDVNDTKWNFALSDILKYASENGRAQVVQLLLDKEVILNRNTSFDVIDTVFQKYMDFIRKEDLKFLEEFEEEIEYNVDSSTTREKIIDWIHGLAGKIIRNILPLDNRRQLVLPAEDYQSVFNLLVSKAQEKPEIMNEIFENARRFKPRMYDFLLNMQQIVPEIRKPFQRKRVRFKEVV